MAKKKEIKSSHYLEVLEWCDKIRTGEILACDAVKKAVKRFVSDYQRKDLYLDLDNFDLLVNFAQNLKQSKGEFANQNLKLLPYQKFIYLNLYGFKNKADDSYRFRKAYLQLARKNGKTTSIVPLMLHNLLTEEGAEVYSAATQKLQAGVAFREAKNMVNKSPLLLKTIRPYREALVYKTGTLQALSSETDKLDGLNPSLCLVDEYHAHSTEDMVSVLQTGMGARKNALLVLITTAGNDKNSPCYLEYEKAKKILDGVFEDDSYFTIIFELDEGDDWKDFTKYIKANPSLGLAVKDKYLKQQLKEALQKPSMEASFKIKNLNMWINANTNWLSDDNWSSCMKSFNEEELEGLQTVGALDLSKVSDFSVLTFYFYIEKLNKYYAKHFFYIPEEQIDNKMKSDNIMIRKWVEQGFITATSGATINYDYIYNDIIEYAKKYNIRYLTYDRNLSNDLINKLKDEFDVIDFNQSTMYMSEPTKNYEKLILDKQLIDNNPVMRWMISCAQITVDANQNVKIIKADINKSSKRIDGIITSIMALDILRNNVLNLKTIDLSESIKSLEQIIDFKY